MSAIEWLAGPDGSPGKTWNPVTGCTKVSGGCRHCYAETNAGRFFASKYPMVEDTALVRGEDSQPRLRPRRFTDVQCHPERLEIPLHWRKPRRVFVNSMSDLFHEDVPDEFIDRVFAVMAATPRHTFLVLTKRPERMREYAERVAASRPHDEVNQAVFDLVNAQDGGFATWPLPNVHMGTSVENQPTAEERIPIILDTPAAVRWVSYEPALGPVDFGQATTAQMTQGRSANMGLGNRRLGWVVVGGESGAGARPCDVAWIRHTVHQCRDAGVPVFVKQLGSEPRDTNLLALKSSKGGDPSEWPEDLRVRELP